MDDTIDELLRAAAATAASGPREVIYLLRHRKDGPASVNRIGGPAPGLTVERWPKYGDWYMEHIFTLDLHSLPDLAGKAASRRTVSLFIHDPGDNEAYGPFSDDVAVVFSDDAQVQAGELALPAGKPKRSSFEDRGWFDVVPVSVPLAVWDDGTEHEELRQLVYAQAARVGGQPLWLQGAEHDDGSFLMQFDEQFVDVNLGDAGVMYLFEDTAFWQCH